MEEGVKVVVKKGNKDAEVELDFQVPDNIVTHLANEIAIQAIHTEFIFSFFEVRLPLRRDIGESAEAMAKAIKPVCVTRVALSVDRIPALIEGLQQRLDDFRATRRLSERNEEGAK